MATSMWIDPNRTFHDLLDGTQPCTEWPRLFFNEVGQDTSESAKAVCRTCPFRRPCLAYALAHSVVGVWGATTETERSTYRRKRGIKARPVHVNIVKLGHEPAARRTA